MDLQERIVTGPDGKPVAPWLDREAWKAARGPRMGSSDIAAILGQDEYKGAWDVYDRVAFGDWDDADSGDTRRGTKQEPVALATFEERFGAVVTPTPMVYHPDFSWMVSDVDGVVVIPDQVPEAIADSPLWAPVLALGGPGAAEVKVPRIPRFYQYKEEGLTRAIVIQMQHHLMVTGLRWGVFVIYTPEYDDMVAFPVLRDEEFCDWLRDAEHAWWREHVVAGLRPSRPAPGPGRWPADVPGDAALRVDDAWMEQAQLLTIRHYELVEAQEAYAETEARLLQLLDPEDRHVAGGGVTVKRRTTKPRRRKDYKALSAGIRSAQRDGDLDTLASIDPNDEAFTYLTNHSEKVEVVVTASNPMEVMA